MAHALSPYGSSAGSSRRKDGALDLHRHRSSAGSHRPMTRQLQEDGQHVKPIQPVGDGTAPLGSPGVAGSAGARCARAHSSGNNSARRSGV